MQNLVQYLWGDRYYLEKRLYTLFMVLLMPAFIAALRDIIDAF